jgi:P27 family predicted phage terminase small subunit
VAGRPRKPTALKLIAGNPGGRALNGFEPEPPLLNDLDPAEHLSPRSAAVWREIAPMLRQLGVLTVADRIPLEMLCDQVADYRLSRQMHGDELVVASSKGTEMLSQWLVAAQMCAKRAHALMACFGMDPVARAKVMTNPQGDLFGGGAGDPASRFFK